jgi:hypothetical protein
MTGHELPPILKGSEQEQLVAMRDYLVRLAQSLDAVSADTTAIVQTKAGSAAPSGAGKPASNAASLDDLKRQATLLKSLIVKTADQIVETAEGTYVHSDSFGDYYEDIESKVQETARATIETYDLTEIVSGIVGLDKIQSFMTLVDGEIRRGVILDPTTGQDAIGIAISQHMSFYADDDPDPSHQPVTGQDGQTYYRIQDQQTFGFYTSTGWQFWINGQKVGWFDSTAADGALHISSAVIENHVQMGDSWMLDITDNGEGIGFRYIGA